VQREQVIQTLVQSPEAIARLKDRKGILRAAVYGELEDGTRAWIELALVPPPPGQAVICMGRPVTVGAPDPSWREPPDHDMQLINSASRRHPGAPIRARNSSAVG